MESFILRGMAANGGIRVVATDTTHIVQELHSRHKTSPTAIAALGRTVSSTLLLAHVLLKNPADRVTVRVVGDGPLGGVITEAGLKGDVRGYVQRPHVRLPLQADGSLSVGAGIGKGDFEVIRSHAPKGEPYSSSIPLGTGEIAEDVANFLMQSEQIHSAVLLGVFVEGDDDTSQVLTAGGVLLQALPNADEAALALLEANVRAFGNLSDAMLKHTLPEILEELCWGLELELFQDYDIPAYHQCRCSRERAVDALRTLPVAERQEMTKEDGGAEVVCHWCNEHYWFSGAELTALPEDAPEQSVKANTLLAEGGALEA